MKCVVCGREIKGHGNNPWPLVKKEGARCCDACNVKVIIERIKLAKENDNDGQVR